MELAKAGFGSAWATSIVAGIVVIGFLTLTVLVLRAPHEIGDAGLMLLGTLSTAFGAVVNYYLGSSLGSASKDAFIKRESRK